jgi:1-deoxy-D-xylulose-5-phosphate reductoisomerase
MVKTIGILGSTGSIGTQTLSVIRELNSAPESPSNPHYKVSMLSCGRNVDLFLRQIAEFRPETVCVSDNDAAARLKEMLEAGGVDLDGVDGEGRVHFAMPRILWGDEGLEEAAGGGYDLLLTAVTGMRGLKPTVRAIEAGTDIALANKETLVAGGELVMRKAKEKGVEILPVDSEHSAVFQCLKSAFKGGYASVAKIILTASGGPFRSLEKGKFEEITAAMALDHPTWKMGRKITVDCATMMNKGLEVIEAMHLFGMTPDRIDVLVHPESIVHSMVEFTDGSVAAQLGLPDMKTPIRLALTYPYRGCSPDRRLDLSETARLTFEKPRFDVFRCLGLAYEAARTGGTLPAVMNGADEVIVEEFLRGKVRFTQIPEIIEKTMEAHMSPGSGLGGGPGGAFVKEPDIQAVLQADGRAREYVRRIINCQ